MIDIKNVYYYYTGHRALCDVSFQVEKGSITALVGPSGAGKSTLLRLLTALDEPHRGSITVGGITTADDPKQIHALIGYLPDVYGLYENMTVAEALSYLAACRLLSPSDAKKRVAEALDNLNLCSLANRLPGALSRGEKQRLGIAQAIVHKPSVLILDEPSTGLDPESRLLLSQLLKDLKSKGVTALVSSHILNELSDYSDHLAVLQEGKLLSVSRTAPSQQEAAGREVVLIVRTIVDSVESPKVESTKEGSERLTVYSDAGFLNPRQTKEGVEVLFRGSPEDQCLALRELYNRGLSILEVFEKHADVQTQYLDIIGRESACKSIQEGGKGKA